MSKREPKLLVGDILESAHKILDYTAGQSFEDFTKDSKTVDAVIRNCGNIPWIDNTYVQGRFRDVNADE